MLIFFWRNIDQNLMSWILVSKQSAHNTLQNSKELENVPANAWKLYFQNKRRQPATVALELYKFLPRLDQVGLQATAAGIFPISTKDHESIMKISDTAIFKNYKLVGWLTNQESQVVNWLKGELVTGTITIELPDKPKTATFDLRNIHVRIVPVFHGHHVIMQIRLKSNAEATFAEESTNFTDSESSKQLEEELNKQIQRTIEKTIMKICKIHNSDIAGFGEIIHRTQPQKWKELKPNWNEYLAEMDVQVDVSAKIVKSGLERVSR